MDEQVRELELQVQGFRDQLSKAVMSYEDQIVRLRVQLTTATENMQEAQRRAQESTDALNELRAQMVESDSGEKSDGEEGV